MTDNAKAELSEVISELWSACARLKSLADDMPPARRDLDTFRARILESRNWAMRAISTSADLVK